MTSIQYAWMVYAAGSLGCCIATWWMFLWAWRFVRYCAVVTVMVILFTPFAIDQETMAMAPAIYTLIFDGLSLGIDSVKPLITLMLGVWLVGIILALLLVLFTRNAYSDENAEYAYPFDDQANSDRPTSLRRKVIHPRDNVDNVTRHEVLTRDEQLSREQRLSGEMPMRAIRD